MKHPLIPTLIIISLFIIAQIVGISVLYRYINIEETEKSGEVKYFELPFGQERPEANKATAWIFIVIAILIGTLILLGLIKLKMFNVWKTWFFLAVWISLLIAFAAFIDESIALVIAAILAAWKIWKPNVIIHNLTELFIYAGIAAMIVPILNIFSGIALLIAISFYDYWAVFKSKHMVELAKASRDSRIFPGLHIEYGKSEKIVKKEKLESSKNQLNLEKANKSKSRGAILGGGDIAFTLLFSGTVLSHYLLTEFAILKTGLVILGAVTGLSITLFLARKDKFYPAMPPITIGCIIGFLITVLL